MNRRLQQARAGLVTASLVVQLASAGERLITAAVAVYFLYAVLEAFRGGARTRYFRLLNLFADTLFFLTVVRFGADRTLWLVAVFFAYLVLSALLLHGVAEMLVVASVWTLFAALEGHNIIPLGHVVVAGSLVGVAASFGKRVVFRRLERLTTIAERAQAESVSAREQERQRIAADFHDGPLQSFISFQIRLDVLRRILERDLPTGLEELRQLQELSQEQVRELRSFVRSMRPVDAEASLLAALRRLVDDFQKESGIPVTVVGGEKPVAVAPESSTDVLQMVREALHNVQKHARASRVAVAVEQAGKTLEISIDDNGTGFPFSGVYTLDELDLLRLGPASLKRRARAIGADLTLESRPGRGAGLKLKIPL